MTRIPPKSKRSMGCDGSVRSAAWAALLTVIVAQPLVSQTVWEVTPYSTRVWWAIDDELGLPQDWSEEFNALLDHNLKVVFRPVVDNHVVAAPKEVRLRLLRGIVDLSAETLFSADPELRKLDKLFLASIQGTRRGYVVTVREFDCRLAHLGPTDEQQVDLLYELPRRAAQMITHSFSPVVRIDRYSEGQAKTRLRAGALLGGRVSIGRLPPNSILLPFDRRVSDTGQTSPQDIRPINWTYLVAPRQPTDSVATMEVISGYKQPFRSKRNRRHQQLAVRARPAFAETRIRLQSRSTTPQPLVGYEIFEKGANKNSHFLGYTDWRGELAIPAGQTQIRTLLVRSGDRVMAKLPIVPGLQPVVVASMHDDRQRVETDAFLSGIQSAVVDLVAKRESLTSRIRRLLAANEVVDAELLIDEFRDLPTEADFRREIQQQQRALRTTDSRLQTRIDTMFAETLRTLGRYLDASRLQELESELARAKSNSN